MREEISKDKGGFEVFYRGYEIFCFTRSATGITYREWAPGVKWAAFIGLGIYFLGSSKSILFDYGCLLINSALRGQISTVNQSSNLF